ncbi:hypothetical protein [Aureibacter tunicatorum]|uniref:Uncharacterized protein n=1 Tax=Aureibacter tunicatorum TaxID=866807 RepID=A0AAE3XU70_9BACT|nr:hypothetical protein [Aureibacter tunicatorum]MDR6241951.1 hypothetical protein [Aureibacter tunicatorum]BDD07504.1 hypothetical protein AUTU_49870 [Aureibacter tunicatorum]
MTVLESLHQFVDKVALKGEEIYAKVGVVTEIQEDKSTCTIVPIDGSPTIYDVKLQVSPSPIPHEIPSVSEDINQQKILSQAKGTTMVVPKKGSFACVIFINSTTAFIGMVEKADKIFNIINPSIGDTPNTAMQMSEGNLLLEATGTERSGGEIKIWAGESSLSIKKNAEENTFTAIVNETKTLNITNNEITISENSTGQIIKLSETDKNIKILSDETSVIIDHDKIEATKEKSKLTINDSHIELQIEGGSKIESKKDKLTLALKDSKIEITENSIDINNGALKVNS